MGPVSETPNNAKMMHLGRPGQLLFVVLFCFVGGVGVWERPGWEEGSAKSKERRRGGGTIA